MKEIKIKDIKEFNKKYKKNKMNKVIENAITNNGVKEVTLNQEVLNDNKMIFNIELPVSKKTDQKNSGRCWCFAGLNMLKYNIASNMNIDIEEFNLSANYLTFYDKLEKINTIYEEILSLKKYDFDTINDLKICEYDEGGHWEFFKELVKKYGLIPEDNMKENTTTENSDIANEIMDSKVKKDIYTILKYKKEKKKKEEMEKLIKKLLSDNYTLLCKLFGEPPLTIKLEYKDKNNNLINEELTPQEFYNKYCTIDLDEYISIGSIDMYNKEYYKKYERKLGESVFNNSRGEFINLPKSELKELVIKQLKDDIPVWFACESTKMCSRDNRIFDTKIYNYEDIFSFKPLTITEGLNLHYYTCSHAMSFVGVHIDKEKIIRWKVENSWGDGYYIMNDNYFDEFVMQVVINKKCLSPKQLKILDTKAIPVKPYDPI